MAPSIREQNTLTIVIPVYNEEKRLAKTFAALESYLVNPIIPTVEIIFVDDGSIDATKEALLSFQEHCSTEVVVLSYFLNKGKGYAVKTGMLRARAGLILMCDADMSTPLYELKKCIPFIEQNVPVIIGSRKAPGSNIIKRQNWLRQKMGEYYASFARLVTGLKVKDLGCGFKLFSRSSAHLIFSQLRNERWVFDTEALYIAQQNKLAVQQIGVDWINDEDSRVKVLSGIFQSLVGLLLIPLYHNHLWKKLFTN